MMTWLISNGASLLILAVIAGLAVLAGRVIYKNKGTCSCGSCRGSCGSCHKSSVPPKKKSSEPR